MEKIRPTLGAANRIDEVQLARELGDHFRAQYRAAEQLAKSRRMNEQRAEQMSRPASRFFVLVVTGSVFRAVLRVARSSRTLRGAFVTNDGSLHLCLPRRRYLEIRSTSKGLSNAFLLAVASTVLAIVLALPLAFLSDRFSFSWKEHSLWPGSRADDSCRPLSELSASSRFSARRAL